MKYTYDTADKATIRSNDKIIVLTPVEGEAGRTSAGMIDKRIFTGENKLHAKYDAQTNLWAAHYEFGSIPEPLKQKFTKFSLLLDCVKEYYKKRNVDVKEVID